MKPRRGQGARADGGAEVSHPERERGLSVLRNQLRRGDFIGQFLARRHASEGGAEGISRLLAWLQGGGIAFALALLLFISLAPDAYRALLLAYPGLPQAAGAIGVVLAGSAAWVKTRDEWITKALERSRSAAREQFVEETRVEVYEAWLDVSEATSGLMRLYCQAVADKSIRGRENVIVEALRVVEKVFSNEAQDAPTLSASLLLPSEDGSALVLVARSKQTSGLAIGGEIPRVAAPTWGAWEVMETKEPSYHPDVTELLQGTERQHRPYKAVLSIPVPDATNSRVLGVVNIDSAYPGAFGEAVNVLSDRTKQAIALAYPMILLIALVRLNVKVYPKLRNRDKAGR